MKSAEFRDAITRRPIRITRTVLFVSVLALATRLLQMLGVELGYGLSLERTTTWLVGERTQNPTDRSTGIFRYPRCLTRN